MNRFFLLLIIGGMMLLSSCTKHELTLGDQQNQIATKLKKSPWKPGAVLRDGVDITGDYTNFSLSFSNGTYTTVNGDLSWPVNGTWAFESGSLTKIIRDGNIPVDLKLSADGKNLTLQFSISSSVYTGGRSTSLQGGYEFQLVQ